MNVELIINRKTLLKPLFNPTYQADADRRDKTIKNKDRILSRNNIQILKKDLVKIL